MRSKRFLLHLIYTCTITLVSLPFCISFMAGQATENVYLRLPINKLLVFLQIRRDASSAAQALGFRGKDSKKKATEILCKLQDAGKIRLVSGVGFSAESTGKPMWEVCGRAAR